MNPSMCLICSDEKEYRRKLQEAKRIKTFLDNLARGMDIDKDNKFYRVCQSFSMGNSNIHFLCGTCYKVNTMELKNVERDINVLLTTIVLSDIDKKVYHEVLGVLQGHYPLKYRTFEQTYRRN